MKITEGYMSYLEWQTYYRIAGEGNGTPLVLLHGGPGSTHNYFELLDELGDERPVIMYDQLGCGKSYLDGHPELWNQDTWMRELIALLDYLHVDRCHLLGQSWGGMLAIAYAIEKKPNKLVSLILSSTLPSAKLWAAEQHRLISFMSEAEQTAIRKAEEMGDFTDSDYLKANEHFMHLHSSEIKDTDPECLRREKKAGTESYVTGWGPNEYTPNGTLGNFDYTDRLGEIEVPALIIDGTNDQCTPLVAKTMYDRIPESRWELFPGSRHMVFAECHDAYVALLREWMKGIEDGNHAVLQNRVGNR